MERGEGRRERGKGGRGVRERGEGEDTHPHPPTPTPTRTYPHTHTHTPTHHSPSCLRAIALISLGTDLAIRISSKVFLAARNCPPKWNKCPM